MNCIENINHFWSIVFTDTHTFPLSIIGYLKPGLQIDAI